MKSIAQNESSAVPAAVECLRAGGVAALPTETVYGLMARWDDAVARERIYELKQRPADKRLQMLASSVAMACRAGVLASPILDALGTAFWPGPLTVVAEAEGGETIGLRVPRHPFLLSVLEELGEPLAATSANLSGLSPALDAEAAVRDLSGEVDVLVDGGTVEVGEASTVVSVVGDELKVLRPGPISEADLIAAMP
jgi:L-threonylcarbamoyladenylate synthase